MTSQLSLSMLKEWIGDIKPNSAAGPLVIEGGDRGGEKWGDGE